MGRVRAGVWVGDGGSEGWGTFAWRWRGVIRAGEALVERDKRATLLFAIGRARGPTMVPETISEIEILLLYSWLFLRLGRCLSDSPIGPTRVRS